jgi:transmembrane sensor
MMADESDRDRLRKAIGWRIRLRTGGPEEWDSFLLWLEQDPACSEAYDRVALADTDLTPEMVPAAPSLPSANDDWAPGPAERHAGRGWAALAAAAALLLAVVGLPWLDTSPGRYEIATRPGEQKIVPIGGNGGSIALNGSSRIALYRADARYAELLSGEAAFTVRHDAGRPFTIVAGPHRVQDAGTDFNVVRDGSRFSVEVAEGSVLIDPGGVAVRLVAGDTLSLREPDGRIALGRKEPHAIAGWRRGQLSFNRAPLAEVARDLSRSMEMPVRIDPSIAGQAFTGSIHIDSDPSQTVERLAATLGMRARRSGAGWLIEPDRRARR